MTGRLAQRTRARSAAVDRPRDRTWRRLRRTAVGVWALALVLWTWRYGVPVDRTLVFGWVAGGLLAASIGRRSWWTVFVDWLPFALVLAGYDFARRFAVAISGYALWTPQIEIDRFLFSGHDPTVWLQEHLKRAHPPWWEVPVSLCYASFFVVPYVVAAVLWLRSRTQFRRWAARFVLMSLLGVVCFTVMPTAPPWAAALCTQADVATLPPDPGCMHAAPSASLTVHGGLLGLLNPAHAGAAPFVERLSGRGWSVMHLEMAEAALYKGQSIANLVAAVPSLHEASALLVAFFFWRRASWRTRPLLVGYPLLMGFTLVYTGEHYVTDLLAALVLVLVVQGVVGWVERRLLRGRGTGGADTLELRPTTPTQEPREQEPREPQCPPIATTPSST